MSDLRVLLVDDEPLALDRLRSYLSDITNIQIVGEAEDGDEALRSIAELKPDLVVLDIQMPGRNGLRTATEIDVEPRPELVFITAHEHYAPDAFEVEAADYLLKPVRFDRLRQAVDRARRRREVRGQAERAGLLEGELAALRAKSGEEMSERDFWVPGNSGLQRVPIDAIDWIEAARDYVLLQTATRSYLLRITMAALEEKLAGGPLVRVHRSAFVRPDRVTEVRRSKRALSLILQDGTCVQVGPSYVDSIKALIPLG